MEKRVNRSRTKGNRCMSRKGYRLVAKNLNSCFLDSGVSSTVYVNLSLFLNLICIMEIKQFFLVLFGGLHELCIQRGSSLPRAF